MKTICAKTISKTVADLCVEANLILRKDVLAVLKAAYQRETNKKAKDALAAIIANAAIARREKLAICQDTGMPLVFAQVGLGVRLSGDLKKAINQGVEAGYRRGYLRNSIVSDPINRGGAKFTPALIHIDLVRGSKLKLTVLPKGFGCENKSQLKMFKPTADITEIKTFIIDAVRQAGPDACPPYIVGVGIGGTADYSCLLAKNALLRKLSIRKKGLSPKGTVPDFERELLSAINKLNIGPMGLGGKTTALAVNIETYPTHIAGLPVAINISCHALRSACTII